MSSSKKENAGYRGNLLEFKQAAARAGRAAVSSGLAGRLFFRAPERFADALARCTDYHLDHVTAGTRTQNAHRLEKR